MYIDIAEFIIHTWSKYARCEVGVFSTGVGEIPRSVGEIVYSKQYVIGINNS